MGSSICCIDADVPGAARELQSDGGLRVLAKVNHTEDWAVKLSELMASNFRRQKLVEKPIESVAHLNPWCDAAPWLQQGGSSADCEEGLACAV